MKYSEWKKVSENLPPENVIVQTKIDDEKGVRNMQNLIRVGNRFYFTTGFMYVYYLPTHWRETE